MKEERSTFGVGEHIETLEKAVPDVRRATRMHLASHLYKRNEKGNSNTMSSLCDTKRLRLARIVHGGELEQNVAVVAELDEGDAVVLGHRSHNGLHSVLNNIEHLIS